MSFNTDNGGLALELKDAKLCTMVSTWNTKLSQIGHSNKRIIICTYSLPKVEDYTYKIFDKRSTNIILVVHAKFKRQIEFIRATYPDIKVYPCEETHAKIVLIEPNTVWLTSGNFGQSGWFEHSIGVHDSTAYQFYLHELVEFVSKQHKNFADVIQAHNISGEVIKP